MATDRMTRVDVLGKGEDPEADVLKEGVRWLIQELIEAEVSAQIGAGRDERTTQRTCSAWSRGPLSAPVVWSERAAPSSARMRPRSASVMYASSSL